MVLLVLFDPISGKRVYNGPGNKLRRRVKIHFGNFRQTLPLQVPEVHIPCNSAKYLILMGLEMGNGSRLRRAGIMMLLS
jgi:hypothetical protein